MTPAHSVTGGPHLVLAVTGHRRSNAALSANLAAVEATLEQICDTIGHRLVAGGGDPIPMQLCNLMAEGIDQITARQALARGWQLAVPLPFGRALNAAINLHPDTATQARAILSGEAITDPAIVERAAVLGDLLAQARVFELAECDDEIAALYLAALDEPEDFARRRAFETQSNDRVELAGRTMIERADLVIAVWDGKVANLVGGTGHTVLTALEMGTPVLLIDPAAPAQWSILTRPEEIASRPPHDPARLDRLIAGLARPLNGLAVRQSPDSHGKNGRSRFWMLYRGLEGWLGVDDTRPEEEGAPLDLAAVAGHLPGVDPRIAQALGDQVLPLHRRADGVATWLSDAYRSGMCLNFLLAALAVIAGAAYLPLDIGKHKWLFAGSELLLLALIVAITLYGKKRDWHARWFATRRLAEYLRHAPIMLMLGAFRPAARWPRGAGSDWPERQARHRLLAIGLPQICLSKDYLRGLLGKLLLPHVEEQRQYHRAKAHRLRRVDHRLDRIAEVLFVLAIGVVTLYLLLKLGATAKLFPDDWPQTWSLLLTFLGIAFPTLGASIAGIRFFADFDRFAAISQVTAEKLDAVAARIGLLLAGPESAVTYGPVSALAHTVDEIVVDELEAWQSVFSGKHMALPA